MSFSAIHSGRGIGTVEVYPVRNESKVRRVCTSPIGAGDMIKHWNESTTASWNWTEPRCVNNTMNKFLAPHKRHLSISGLGQKLSGPVPTSRDRINFDLPKQTINFFAGQRVNCEVALVIHDVSSSLGNLVVRAGMALKRCLGSTIIATRFEKFNDKWPLATRPLKWLVDKFSPVPGWENYVWH
jgi:hypothetical protein